MRARRQNSSRNLSAKQSIAARGEGAYSRKTAASAGQGLTRPFATDALNNTSQIFCAAVKKAQQTPFLRGEGARGWRASFDWFVANHLNIYAVLEGKYDGPAAGPNKGGANDNASFYGGRSRPSDCRENESRRSDLHPPPVSLSVHCAAGRDGGAPETTTRGYRRCECVKARFVAARLAAIPELFRGATFESYQRAEPAAGAGGGFDEGLPEGSWYMTGHYGSGKTHLFYAQYRELAVAGKTRCHVRTTRELVEELKRMRA